MAYAGIAGLPPQAGLYTLLAALLVYALLGTSRHLVVQATSATAALLASAVAAALVATAAATASDPEAYQTYASAFVLVTGLVFLAAGIARLGFITQFLSKPVMDGFVTGLAIFVAVGQLNKLFGVPKPEGNTVEKLLGIIKELPQANWVAFAVGAAALAVLFLLPRWNKKIPAGLVVLFGAIALSAALDLNGKYGVEIVGTLPQGLPIAGVPEECRSRPIWRWCCRPWACLLVAYSEALGVAHEFAEKHGYEVDANQELNAHAVAEPGERVVRRHARRRQHVGLGGQRRRGRPLAGDEPGHLGRHDHHRALPHALVHDAARSRARRADHPCGLAHHRLAQAAEGPPGVAGRVLVCACWRWPACCSLTFCRA